MERFRFSLLVFLFAVLGSGFAEGPRAVSAQQQNQHEEQGVCFRWAFGAIQRGEHKPELFAITSDETLKSGDQFKMFVELLKKCFVYLIHPAPRVE